ncbi:hypothetical protein COOONC_10532 [Cooperia oncophora]
MAPIVKDVHDDQAYFVKGLIDEELTMEDGFESYLFSVGEYNNAVGTPFKLPHDPDTVCVLIISTPNMFDVSFKRWIQTKFKELGSLEAVSEAVSSPIQEFLQSRLEPVCEKFDSMNMDYELLHDHSLWPSRKPKILMQTCGHVAVVIKMKFVHTSTFQSFRDFGGPRKRYSVTQMEFFGRPPAERWSVLKEWCEE